MKPVICNKCQEDMRGWVEFCPSCGEPNELYARPAGFWIRVGANIIDSLIFAPVIALGIWNTFSLKNMALLIAISIPGLFYKPFMESLCGATLGKMACGIKVVDDNSQKLTLSSAYIRFLPFLAQAALALTGQVMLFGSAEFQSASSFIELSQVQQDSITAIAGQVVNVLILIDCVCVAFTFRKRALHDMLAESYCVYK